MASLAISASSDQDALHKLPLSIIPLKTHGLKKARLIKNPRLEGVVELYSGDVIGSAQVPPEHLNRVFQFDERNRTDLKMIQVLSELPSYDVYSLRIELRRLEIPVDDHSSLQLSEAKKQSLAGNMREFTQPLISLVYGGAGEGMDGMSDIMRLFTNPDKDQARKNLVKMSKALNVEITAIPQFLQTYGDVYLSLAYYQQCLDQSMPVLVELLDSLSKIQAARETGSKHELVKTCRSIERNLKALIRDIKNILEVFKMRTSDMWENISSESFSQVEEVIKTYQARIGGGLCAITVKLNAWKDKFPNKNVGSVSRRAEFVMSDLRHGVERIQEIGYVG